MTISFLDVVISNTDNQDALEDFKKASDKLKDRLPDDMKEEFDNFIKVTNVLIYRYAEAAWRDSIKKSTMYGRISYD